MKPPPIKPRYTDADSRIAKVISPNLSAWEVAQLAFTNVQSVYRYCHKFNTTVKPCKSFLNEEQKQQIREMANRNVGVKKIADTINATRNRVHEFMVQEGLPFKSFPESVKKEFKDAEFFSWEMYENGIF